MQCYHPIKAYPYGLTKNGKQALTFKAPSEGAKSIKVPCGQCIGCRLERSRQWAVRIMHESQMYEDNCFITLTYNDDNLPEDQSLNKRDLQLFMKRLRKHGGKEGKEKIRFFACGEYGEETLRPHYHACLFNYDFRDKIYLKTVNGNKLYHSDLLSKLWPFGFNTIGSLTFDSAAYVARYVTKKLTGKGIEKAKAVFGLSPYNRCDMLTGELYDVLPEFQTQSLKPGIGKTWYEKYQGDCYPSDEVIVNGKKTKPPRYYDTLYPDIESIKEKRVKRAEKRAWDNTPKRLRIKETIKMAQYDQLKRGL